MVSQAADHSNRLTPTTTAIPQVVRDHLAPTPAQLHRQRTSHQASKVQASTGHRVGNTNHLVNIQLEVTLRHILAAPNMAKPGKTCREYPRTDITIMARRITLVNRISHTPLYLVANTTHPFPAHQPDSRTLPFLARQAHNQISPSPARQAPSITHHCLVLQRLNITNPTLAHQVVPRIRPFLRKLASMARRFQVHQAGNLPAVNITKPILDHQPANTVVQILQLFPIHQRLGRKPPRDTGRKRPHYMDNRHRLPLVPNLHQRTVNKLHRIRLNLKVRRITNTHSRASRASTLLNRSRTPRFRARQVATTHMHHHHHHHQWALTQGSRVPMRVCRVLQWASQV